MKSKWIKKVAVILSLSLILNSGFLDLAGYVYAAGLDSAQNTADTAAKKEAVTEPTKTEPESSEDKKNPETESTQAAETESTEIESTGTESSETESTAVEEETTAEKETETEATTEEETQTAAEEETVVEDGMQNAMRSNRASTDENRLPDTIEEYLANKKDKYYIQDWADFIKVQEFCNSGQVDGFSGVTFTVLKPEENSEDAKAGIWNTSEMRAYINGNNYTFFGIGNESNPFKGKMECYFDSGVMFKLDRPLFHALGDGAVMDKMKLEANGCCSPIAETIAEGKVTLSNLTISGIIGKGSSTAYAGTFAAEIGKDVEITIENVTSTANISAGNAGGIAGRIESGVSLVLPESYVIGDAGKPITVTGTNATGGLFGVVRYEMGTQDTCEIDVSWMNHVAANVLGNGGFAGGLIGIAEENADILITGGESIKVRVDEPGGKSLVAGGLIGKCDRAKLSLEQPLTIEGSVGAGNGVAGGAVGEIRDTDMELSDITIAENTEIKGDKVGGVVGFINHSDMILDTITINGALTAKSMVGGLFGRVENASALELQGKIKVADRLSASAEIGSIAGEQDNSLIYLHGMQGKENGETQLEVPMQTDSWARYREVYNCGGVFRNQDMGSGTLLIGDGTLEHVGEIHNTISGGAFGTSGEIDAAADLETFAIVNYTNGYFGAETFGKTKDNWKEILKDSYTLHNDADISYEITGIISLNRNDKIEEDFAFAGSLSGNGGKYTITQNSNTNHERVGIFSSLTGENTFSNLIIEGKVERASHVGGLAYRTVGTGLHLSNLEMRKTFTECQLDIGGVLAREEGGNHFNLEAEDVVLASVIEAGGIADFSGFITKMEDAEVDIRKVTLGGSLSNTSNSAGGFLGKEWLRVGGTMDTLTVEAQTSYETRGVCGVLLHTVSSKNTGSILTMKDVNLENLNVALGGQGDCSLVIHNGKQLVLEMIDYRAKGAVVSGAAADFDEIMALNDVQGYEKTFGVVSIHNTTGPQFPAYHYENQATYTGSAPTMNGSSRYYYDVFQTLNTTAADGTVTAAVKIGKEGDYYVIDSPEKYFLWDVLQCCGGDNALRNTFAPYFEEGAGIPSNWGRKYYFVGELDLTDYSVYPVPRQGNATYEGKDAKFIFAAAGMENWTLPNNKDSQHCMLHSGFLYSTYDGDFVIKDLTFSGTIGCYRVEQCGVLVAGNLKANAEITNITLENLSVSGYGSDSSTDTACLLIGEIEASTAQTNTVKTVILDGIEMKGYSSGQAGASLIYRAGSTNATNLSLRFHDMKLEHNLAEGSKYGEILKYSSFIYDYNYTNNASINKGSGLYLFSEADESADRVTYGAELNNDTEYSDTVNKVFKDGVNKEGKEPSDYIPYIYREKEIEVNPKSGDILKGCGTYEDPYIIETSKQFLTLYRYINEPEKAEGADYQYESFYQNWKMIKTGDDSTFCSVKHRVSLATDTTAETDVVTPDGGNTKFTGDGAEDARIFGMDGFPTPEQLSRAYYRLGADIDLSGITSGTYGQIALDFVGFGTSERPFAGVLYGKDEAGEIHTITLPDKKDSTQYNAYGLIQYAQGAVVKDLHITSTNPYEGTQWNPYKFDKTASISGVGGSVMAYILGGDNIIDNVTTSLHLLASGNAVIGGYAGIVQKGGLILRNVEDSCLDEFRIYQDWWVASPMWGSMVGKVEDGYVLWEGSGRSEKVLSSSHAIFLKRAELQGGVDSLPAPSEVPGVSQYSILNGDVLENDAQQDGGVSVAITDTAGSGSAQKDVRITIPNAAALQIMAMAMNADALNVCPSNYCNYAPNHWEYLKTHWGYSEKSRSRKADYSQIGCSSSTEDYVKAAKYDNANNYSQNGYSEENANKAYAYPFLFAYAGIEGEEYLPLVSNGYSILNLGAAEPVSQNIYHVYWQLAENKTYDLSVYEQGFQGIGAQYRNGGDWYGASFRGDFDGKGSTVKYAMVRNVYRDSVRGKDPTNGQRRAGLFNILQAPKPANTAEKGIYNQTADFGTSPQIYICPAYKIANVNVTGTIDVRTAENNDANNYGIHFGGLVGEIASGNYVFENIGTPLGDPLWIEDPVSDEKEKENLVLCYGGIVGRLSNQNSYVMLQDCHFIGSEEKPIKLKGVAIGGGLVGWSSTDVLKLVDCKAEWLEVTTVNSSSLPAAAAGGMVGYVDNYGKYLILRGSDTEDAESPFSVKNSTINGYQNAGGIVGGSAASTNAYHLYSYANTIKSYRNMGGIVGILSNTKISTLEKIVVEDMEMEEDIFSDNVNVHAGKGGVVGVNEQNLTIKNARVKGQEQDHTGDVDGSTYTNKIAGGNNKQRQHAIAGAGGIVGTAAKTNCTLTLEDCSVSDTYIFGDSVRAGSVSATMYAGVGGICGYNESEIIAKGSIQTSNTKVETQAVYLPSSNVNVHGIAGGIFGMVRAKISAGQGEGTTAYAENVSATKNTVIGEYAGGLIGYIERSNVRLQGVNVQGGSVTSEDIAGGLVGYMDTGSDGAAFNEPNNTKTNLVSDVKITGRVAGGAFGYVKMFLGDARAESVKIQNTEIIAAPKDASRSCSAGGLMGELYWSSSNTFKLYGADLTKNTIVCETESDTITELKNYSAGGLLGRTDYGSTVGIGGEMRCDGIQIWEDNRIGLRQTGTDAVKLVKKTGDTYRLSDVAMPKETELQTGTQTNPETGEETEESAKNYHALAYLEQEYGYCVGTIIGAMTSDKGQVYILSSADRTVSSDKGTTTEEFTIPVMKENPPVTDVGRINDTMVTEESDTYYSYRKTAHIIYGAPITERIGENGSAYQAGEAFKNVAYMKDRVEQESAEYTQDTGLEALLKNYRISAETIKLFNNTYEETYTFPGSDHTVGPILVFKPENGTIQKVLECMTDVMTNVAGASASDMKHLQITCQQKIVRGNAADGGSGSITNGSQPSVSANITNGQVTYVLEHEDGLTEDGTGMTYTEITYTYGYNDGRGKVFKLPVYVEEPVYYGAHMKIMEGIVSSVAMVREKGILADASIQIVNDSDYTLLMEYTYGKARKKMPDNVIAEKYFYMEENKTGKELPVGTKLRLIDVTHGNVPYYYEVKEKGVTKIKFSDFIDGAGNKYVNQPLNTLETETDEGQSYYSDLAADEQKNAEEKALHQLEETGVERYLLTVMNENKGNVVYSIHTDMEAQVTDGTPEQNAGAASQFAAAEEHEQMPYFTVTAVPGLIIKLEDGDLVTINGVTVREEEKTSIEGTIERESVLDITATISLKAEDEVYWQLKKNGNSMDSENNGKYLDLAFYLQDGKRRINLPDGTNFSYKLANGGYSENKVMQNSSVTYYYKDIRALFGEDIEYKIENLTQDTEFEVSFRLNFAGADLSEFTSGSYTANVELLKTSNREYPMGSGNSLDIYSKEVRAQSVSNLGFAIGAVDVNQLAINTYPAAKAEGNTIDYQTMFDFSDILKKISGVGEDTAIEKWADFDYEVTYQLYRKTENGANVVYTPYTDNDIVIQVTDAKGEQTSVNGSVNATYQFTEGEIKNGTSFTQTVNGTTETLQQEGLIVRPGKMEISTAQLAGQQENLTNYKIIATLTIREREQTGEGGSQAPDTEAETTDFFVFTVTKLKTDLTE